jgi:glycosyltransferase involved in cell wall biosynthesis
MAERWPVLLMVRTLDFGGSERQCAVTAMSLDRTRFEPFVGVFRREGFRVRDVEKAGIPVVRFDVRGFASPSALKAALEMSRFIHERRIRLVHTFDVPSNLFGVPAARAARGPVVLSSARANRALTPGVRHRALRFTDRLADGIVVNCEAMREHLVRDEGVPRERTHLCYNGIDVETFHARRPAARPKEYAGAQLVVGVVCGLRVEKGLETLVAAYARISTLHAGMRLVFVGSGVCLPELQAQARRLGIEEQTIFVPARPEVADLLRGIDVFVLPSRSEALSNSLMEAMSCGCCAVASAVGGNPELVHDGRTGLLFTPGDVEGLAAKLLRVVEDGGLRARLGEQGSRSIQTDFSQEASGARMQEIYTTFLKTL